MHREDPHGRLRESVGLVVDQVGVDSSLLEALPKRWERFADVALLQRGAFAGKEWEALVGPNLWKAVAGALKVERVGRIGEIVGERRESSVELLLGEDDWVVRRENGVEYGYRFTQCMFSAGNVNERRRMGEVGRADEIVVDLFCGIGYYSLPMLLSEVAHVHCCEWNPNAVAALEWGLESNGVIDKCTIHEGDNRATAPKLQGIADRVVLGLLPTAEGGYDLAVDCLKESGGILHIHGVAPADNHQSWVEETIQKFEALARQFDIEEAARVRVKSYAPHWDHLVLDLEFSPRA